MGIMKRFMRLCKADIHGVMDQLEDRGLLLKQHLRDMAEEIGRKEANLRQMVAFREQTQRAYERYTEECEKLDRDIEAAISKDKDDIARLLIKKFKPLASHCDELSRLIQSSEQEIKQFRECVEKQRFQYDQIQLRSKQYLHRLEREEWERTLPTTSRPMVNEDPSEGEVELELLKRKEASNGGV